MLRRGGVGAAIVRRRWRPPAGAPFCAPPGPTGRSTIRQARRRPTPAAKNTVTPDDCDAIIRQAEELDRLMLEQWLRPQAGLVRDSSPGKVPEGHPTAPASTGAQPRGRVRRFAAAPRRRT